MELVNKFVRLASLAIPQVEDEEDEPEPQSSPAPETAPGPNVLK